MERKKERKKAWTWPKPLIMFLCSIVVALLIPFIWLCILAMFYKPGQFFQIMILYIGILFIIAYLLLGSAKMDKKIFDPYFPNTQPIRTAIRNRKDYIIYRFKGTLYATPVRTGLIIVMNLIAASDLFVLSQKEKFEVKWPADLANFADFLSLAGIFIPLALDIYLFAQSYNERFTRRQANPNAYDDVVPPAGWQKLTLVAANNSDKDFVIFSEDINKWLQDDNIINIRRDRSYSKDLRKRIYNESDWNAAFLPFLRQNFRDAIHTGKQFYNESKYGLSHELNADNPISTDNGKNTYIVNVHKTCYFDSFLTNIIPGSSLISNQTLKTVANTDNLMPYQQSILKNYNNTETVRTLCKYEQTLTANEPGVSTLLITDDAVLLWRQNRLAQSSVGKIVASGSGSADWRDCKKYLSDSDDSFRKTIVYGMQRELWEESCGTRNITEHAFMNCVETRITGYFRWLKKAGKAEFVGITRIRRSDDEESNAITQFSPEISEVTQGYRLSAKNMYVLQENLSSLKLDKATDSLEIGEYNISCAMALYRLKMLCAEYCAKKCNGSCLQEQCTEKPVEVLFEEAKVIRIEK